MTDNPCGAECAGYPECSVCFKLVEDDVQESIFKRAFGTDGPPRSRFVFAISPHILKGYVIPLRIISDECDVLATDLRERDPPGVKVPGCPTEPGVYVGTLVWGVESDWDEWKAQTYYFPEPERFENVAPISIVEEP